VARTGEGLSKKDFDTWSAAKHPAVRRPVGDQGEETLDRWTKSPTDDVDQQRKRHENNEIALRLVYNILNGLLKTTGQSKTEYHQSKEEDVISRRVVHSKAGYFGQTSSTKLQKEDETSRMIPKPTTRAQRDKAISKPTEREKSGNSKMGS